jgi:hypothetical protein
MTQIQAGEGARFPHRRSPRGSLRERRSGMENGVCQEKSKKAIYARPCDDSSPGSQETPQFCHCSGSYSFILTPNF